MEIPAILTVDIGPDDAVLGNGRAALPRWERTEAGLSLLRDRLHALEDEFGMAIPATWFVRADDLIVRQLGRADGAFRKFELFLRAAVAAGHEAGWLPQQPAEDGAPDVAQHLARTHSALSSLGIRIRSARAGKLGHDNASMAALDALGIEFDSSALPGRTRIEGGWCLDWAGTPRNPYRPSVADYRVPGEPHLDVCEVPLTTLPMQAPYDAASLERYVNPCMHSTLLWPGLSGVLRDADYLLCVLHPDEIVPRRSGGHPLIGYSADVFSSNLREMVRACRDHGRKISFMTLAGFAGSACTDLATGGAAK